MQNLNVSTKQTELEKSNQIVALQELELIKNYVSI